MLPGLYSGMESSEHMSSDNRYNALSRSVFFNDFSERSRHCLAAAAHLQLLPGREVLFHEGEEGGWVYLLVSGRVQLHRTTEEGREVVIKIVSPGELFAEAVLFERPDYPVTATALIKCELLRIARKDLQTMLEEADFRNDFIAGLMGKMRFLTSRIVELTANEVADRLLAFLNEQLAGRDEGELPINKQAVAAAIGTTPETLSRTIQKLTGEKRLTWQGNTVRLMR